MLIDKQIIIIIPHVRKAYAWRVGHTGGRNAIDIGAAEVWRTVKPISRTATDTSVCTADNSRKAGLNNVIH